MTWTADFRSRNIFKYSCQNRFLYTIWFFWGYNIIIELAKLAVYFALVFPLILRKRLRFRKVLKKTHLLTWYRYRSTLLHNTSFNWHTHNNRTSRVKDVLRKDSKLTRKYCNVFEFFTFLLLQFLGKEIHLLIKWSVSTAQVRHWLRPGKPSARQAPG